MDNEQVCIVGIFMFLCVLTLTIGGCDAYKHKVAIENGCEEVMLPGKQQTSWQKVKK